MRLAPSLFVAVTWILALSGGLATAVDANAPEVSPDEQTLTAAGLGTDGPALLEFFRSRTRNEADQQKLLALTRQLGDPSTEVRARAAAELIGRGPAAVPALRHAVNDIDNLAVSERARKCLQSIEGKDSAALPAAAARLLAVRKPAGATEVLLAYLPFADNQDVVEDVSASLSALAFPDGKPDSALLRGLTDSVPIRRAVAGAALCRKEQPEQWPTIRKLLRDPKPMVRLRVALSLAEQHDLEAFPALIDLLADLPAAHRKLAEDHLQRLAGEWSPNPALQGDDDVARRIRRDAWAGWWKNTDGPTLLAEFRKRTLTAQDQAKVQSLIESLAADEFAVRQQAVADLVAYGPVVVPFLREAARGTDRERVRRAEECLQLLAKKEDKPLPTTAARLVALRKPEGAVEVLLDFLPFASETMTAEVQEALTALALRDGKVEPALVRALDDKLAVRRAAAAEALSRAGGLEIRPTLRKLLKDADLTVRLRVALTLATAQEKEAVAVLIDLLADLPGDQVGQAHELLYLLAGEKAPKESPGGNEAERKKCRDAWAAWWKENGDKVDLAQLGAEQRLLGYTLLVQVNDNNIGRVIELGRDGKPRWEIGNLQYPVDAFVLGGNRVLIAEWSGRTVSERDLKGKVLWKKDGLQGSPTNAQKLPNGNVFISTNTELLEVDRDGKTVFSKPFQGVIAAYKTPNGRITVLANTSCHILDATGKEIKSFPSDRGPAWTSGLDVLPNGHFLIAQTDKSKVAEKDAEGKTVWEADAPNVTTATRLANGNTLVASHGNRSVVELNRAGKVVWEYKDEYHIFRARRR
jgi:HEAT repeat protein